MSEQMYALAVIINYKDGAERQVELSEALNLGALEDAIADYIHDGLASSWMFTVVPIS